jgi:diguanylate cyclase (GGDEF)-like protein/PAS domain S-box-containing protein
MICNRFDKICTCDESEARVKATIENISEHASLEDMPSLSSRALTFSNSCILIADARQPGYPIVFANPAFCRMSGYVPEEVLGKDFLFLQSSEDEQAAWTALRNALANGDDIHTVLRNCRKDGSLFWSDLSIASVTDDAGKLTHFIAMQSDATEQKRHEERLAFQATHDALTELPNRQLLKQHLREAMLQTEIARHIVALLIVDIDHFKLINNSIDHDGADLLLQSVAERLRTCVKAGDILSRHGADEFGIVLRDLDTSSDVAESCEKISRAIALPFVIKGQTLHVTCSIGIALYPQDGSDAAMLLKYADTALSRAKELGRNNSQFFSNEMTERALERVKLENELRLAISKNQLQLHYQPLVDLQTGQVTSLEALSRWRHPELGTVPPTRFIAVAEECGLIAEIGDWVLRTACRDMQTWKDNGIADVRVAINVSPTQFRDPLLADKVDAALTGSGISPSRLCLEITENVLMQDTPSSEATLARLKALGVDLVLDDFGTGFSSLSYLKRFSFDKVKIDRAFVQDVVTNTDDSAISKAIILMAHSLGIRVVAEGVETEAQCDFLRGNMCDEIQGFFFSEALGPTEIETFLREGHRLPDHLLRMQKPPRTLLLVDDEVNIVASLKRLLRPDNYHVLTANSGQEGLDLLTRNDVDVIVSDQRMPGMTGVEFLSQAKVLYPDTIRIVLSGYTELQSVTDAVNEGAIYKFLTKPWDDTQLRGHVEEAFRRKEMADENMRLNLEVRTANFELATANRRLERVLTQQQQQIKRDEVSLDVVREALQHVPAPVIGLDEDEVIAFVNSAAQLLFKDGPGVLGCDAEAVMPGILSAIHQVNDGEKCSIELNGLMYQVISHNMGRGSQSRGKLMTLTRE